jgi:hypothetical protein
LSDDSQALFLIVPDFSKKHERAFTLYLQDDRKLTTDQWRLLYEAIGYLDRSEVEIGGERFTFRQLYNRHIDQAYADEYLEQLLRLTNLAVQRPLLTATFARQIAPTLERAQLLSHNNPQSHLLFTYCVYCWQSFAHGYAFEVEIKRDLEASKIVFAMHDILSRAERYSRADLIVLDLLGDIKTSTYFLQEKADDPLANDFYITRLYEKGYAKTLVVFQKHLAWVRIGGQAPTPGNLNRVLNLLPHPVQLEQSGAILIVIDYETWKTMVRRTQAEEGVSNE